MDYWHMRDMPQCYTAARTGTAGSDNGIERTVPRPGFQNPWGKQPKIRDLGIGSDSKCGIRRWRGGCIAHCKGGGGRWIRRNLRSRAATGPWR
eukprot:scaffold166005_cov32-Tisochrysis_lutea.AAC.2